MDGFNLENEYKSESEIALERAKKEELTESAPILAKWIKVLFWFSVIGGTISSIASVALSFFIGYVGSYAPERTTAFKIIMAAMTVVLGMVYFVIYYMLSQGVSRFKVPMYCQLASIAVSVFSDFAINTSNINRFSISSFLSSILSLAIAGLSIYKLYCEYSAYREAVCDLDSKLALKWKKLWTRFWVGMVAYLGGTIVVTVITAILAVVGSVSSALVGSDMNYASAFIPLIVVVFAGLIYFIVLGIQYLCYLYKTAKTLEKYCVENGIE